MAINRLVNKKLIRSISLGLAMILPILLLAACGKRSKIEQYNTYLKEENYAAAAAISDNLLDSEDGRKALERSLAVHLLSLQTRVTEGSLALDAYTEKLNLMASLDISSDGRLVQAAAQRLISEEEAGQIIDEAERAAKNSNWQEALRLMDEARPFSTSTAEMRQLFASIRQSYKQDIAGRVESLEAKGSLEAAESLLAEAIEVLPGDTDLAVSLTRIKNLSFTQERTALLQNVNNLRSQDAWGPALDAIRLASPDVAKDVEVSALKDQIEFQYEEDLLEKLETLEAQNKLDEALDQVKIDLEVFPDSLRLQWKLRIYEALVESATETSETEPVESGTKP